MRERYQDEGAIVPSPASALSSDILRLRCECGPCLLLATSPQNVGIQGHIPAQPLCQGKEKTEFSLHLTD
jgi:hypothetical protein